MPALDAVVVGSGPNGLAAALVLARAGLRVLVREAAPDPGGGARTLPLTLPGFLHDHCSAIHPLAAASPLFRRLALAQHRLRWIEPPAAVAHPFDDGTAALLLRSLDETGATLDAADAAAWRELLAPLVERYDALLDETLGAIVHVPRHPVLLGRFGLLALRSASALVRDRFRGPRARALLAGIAAHAMRPLDAAATAAFGLVLGAAGHAVGWPFPAGGAGRITDALVAELAAHGGAVETSAEVRDLAELPRARAVVLDLTPRQVLRVAGARLPARYARRLARYRYGPAAFKVDYALAAPIPWRAAGCARAATVHLGGSLEELEAAEAAVARGVLPDRPFVLVVQHTLFDPSRAPAGRHTAWAYGHVPHAFAGDATAALEAQIERFAPGFQERVLARAVRGPARLEADDANLVGGDIGGGETSLEQMIARPVASPAPWATPVRGLYLCSSSTPPGGGVHGMCGANAARVVLRDLARGRLA
ncbi:phytoene desaturase family protein [Anaeromyxobacter oryzae]|uniref:FAD-dependent oxidoreductase n=1 Tax=Anaeromyxobacter oryzae TaxID=2918170 RepID=A0ABN6MS32_9BACT|nr:NAD(P)/FAD-dependent oxidoreductase [Anaeromyxobacter oryzae]BDG03785.1 FAD-dependent oxidoreductase [Anaeromyxobacter oryzae]